VFEELIASNKRRTAVMIAVFVALVVLVVSAINYLAGFGVVGFVIALVIAGVSAFAAYFNSDKVALRMSRARPADPREYARFHNLVEGLCIASGLPKPKLYVIDDPAPNAFATGRNPQHSAVAVTTGLLEKMNRVELEAVLAHELSHVRNYDILVMTLAVTLVGVVALLSDFFLRFSIWGGPFAGRGRRDSNDSNPVGLLLAVFGFLLVFLAPIVARLMQLAVSRRREYLADATGVSMTRYPPALISALEKLRADSSVVHTASKATAHLWIESPLDETPSRTRKFDHLFQTHPPLAERIRVLQEL
jgi:heat shock protein HtpX